MAFNRRLLELEEAVAALEAQWLERKAEVLGEALPDLSDSDRERAEQFDELPFDEQRRTFRDLPMECHFYMVRRGRKEVAESPYHFSDLAEWLDLETWAPKEALLLLAGASPKGALVDWSYENYVGAEIHEPVIRKAEFLRSVGDDYSLPDSEAWEDDIRAAKKRLREQKSILSDAERQQIDAEIARLQGLRDEPSFARNRAELKLRTTILAELWRHWRSSDHDPEKRNSPEHFIAWAQARNYRPEWLEWAQSQGLVDQHEGVYKAPFFDPDADDYPELLHIAVRAWEAARQGGHGTPKQRLERFLERRYPTLSPTTRELIAQVANWRRTGGRPKA